MRNCRKCEAELETEEEQDLQSCIACLSKYGTPCFRCGSTFWRELKKKRRIKSKMWCIVRCVKCGFQMEIL